MTRADYRKARALIRTNGLYALRWLTVEHAPTMLRIVRPAADTLAQRADAARTEAQYGTVNSGAMAFRLTTRARMTQNVNMPKIVSAE